MQPDERRIAVAPVGDGFEELPVGERIGVDRLEPRMHGARVGQRHAGLQPEGEATAFTAVRRSADLIGAATTSASSGA